MTYLYVFREAGRAIRRALERHDPLRYSLGEPAEPGRRYDAGPDMPAFDPKARRFKTQVAEKPRIGDEPREAEDGGPSYLSRAPAGDAEEEGGSDKSQGKSSKKKRAA